jgi:hypothetical protein
MTEKILRHFARRNLARFSRVCGVCTREFLQPNEVYFATTVELAAPVCPECARRDLAAREGTTPRA